MRLAFIILMVFAAAGGLVSPARCRTPIHAQKTTNPVTSFPLMVSDIKADARRCPWIRLAEIGKSHDGRGIWLVRVTDPHGPSPSQNTRLLCLFRQHGDEPATTEAILGLLHRISIGEDHTLRHITLYTVPMVNPDGASASTRCNGVGADLNRDWGIFSQPETRAVAHIYRMIRPQIVVDDHNWDTTDSYNANCIEVERDVQTPLAKAARMMQAAAIAQMAALGCHVNPTSYNTRANPHLAHRWFASQGSISCLIETHSGSPYDTSDYLRRQAVYVALIHILARHYGSVTAHLNALEHLSDDSCRDTVLFPILRPKARLRQTRPAAHSAPWPWALLAYGFILFMAYLSRGFAASDGPHFLNNKRKPTRRFRSGLLPKNNGSSQPERSHY